MLYSIFHFLFGFCRVELKTSAFETLLTRLLAANIRMWSIERLSDDTVRFCVRTSAKVRLMDILRPFAINGRLTMKIEEKGLVSFLKRYRMRFGLLAGTLVGIFLMLLSTFFVWGVTIETNCKTYTQKELVEMLESVGVHPGARISAVEEDELPLRFLLEYPEFVFAAFNVHGTVVYAELMTRAEVPQAPSQDGPCHLTAAQGGIIELCEVYNGEPMVRPGDVVDAGDLLVSGTMTLRAGGYRVVQSRAKILARTYREFEFFQPFEIQERVFTGQEQIHSSLQVLSRDLLARWPSHTSFEESVAVSEVTQIEWFSLGLPLYRHRVTHHETVLATCILDEERAREKAYDAYRAQLSELLGEEGRLLSDEISYEVSEDGVTIRVRASLIENIVETTPFEVHLTPETQTEES